MWSRTGRGVSALASICLLVTPAIAQTATTRIVRAANAFLSTLDQKQRQAERFSFDDEEQRKRWSNLPVSFVRRSGINLKDMNDTQRSAAMTLVASALSPKGFEKVQQIMEGDEVNKTTDQGPGGDRGPRPRLGNGAPSPGNGGPRRHSAVEVTARLGADPSLARICITSLYLANRPREFLGFCNSEATIWRSTSLLPGNVECSRQL